jgi:hypothetical protein
MKTRLIFIILMITLMFLVGGCKEKTPKNKDLTTVAALNNYWQYQADLNGSLDAREATGDAMVSKIQNLGSKGEKDGYAEIKAQVDTYISQSESAAAGYDKLLKAENAIKIYGDSKGLLSFGSDCAKGIYYFGRNTVVGGAHLARSTFRVVTGNKTLREVCNDPDSGIPFCSRAVEKMQQYVAAGDVRVREIIMGYHPEDLGTFPYSSIPGITPQEKLNNFNNMADDDPIKKAVRGSLPYCDPESRTNWSKLFRDVAEVGVNTVADAFGSGVVNEVINQHIESGQPLTDKGTLKIQVNQQGGSDPAITAPKTITISKANKPENDVRITVFTDAPNTFEQPLPTGTYNVIVTAEGYIRQVYENLQIVQGQVNSVVTKMLKLADNPILIEDLTVDNDCIAINEAVTARVSCISTIGQDLSFAWTVTGGAYTEMSHQGTRMSFTPSEQQEYTISVTVSDKDGNTKIRSLAVTTLGGKLAIDEWTIATENFPDNKLNPGETATVKLMVSNTGELPLTGIQSAVGSPGISVNLSPSTVTIAAGETKAVQVPIVIATALPDGNGWLRYTMQTQNANNIPVLISDSVEFPIELNVSIDPIETVVTNRVLQITGTVSNPSLTTAVLLLNGDIEHGYDLTLSNGNFAQQIILKGSSNVVTHNVRVIAVSGALAAEGTMSFESHVPLMALRATLTWNTSGTDVDFWMTDPNGEKCYYAHRNTASGLVLDVDDTNGYGPENITTQVTIPGDYLVQVHYY